MSDTVESLLAYCRDNGRVCPIPARWMTLWELLPNRTRVGNGWQPPLPLILGAWHDTPDLQKVLRLSEHIKWASSNHALDSVAQYLRALPEVEWHHVGD